MASVRKVKLLIFILFISILLLYYMKKMVKTAEMKSVMDFTNFNNVTGTRTMIVPNLIHFIHFDLKDLDFVTFICILSAHYNHQPSKIYIHSNVNVIGGHYLPLLMDVMGDRLVVNHWLEKPTHVYGQKLSSVHHAADVARIKILMKFGGIFLDADVFVIKSLNSFRHFECVVGWPKGQNMGNQVIVAHKDARFLKHYMNCYQEYRPSMWYYNAGESPTQNVLSKQPSLVHREMKAFGVENLSEELYKQNWAGWINRHTIHLLQRHRQYLTEGGSPVKEFDENNIDDCDCTFKTLVNQILEFLEEDGVSLRDKSKGGKDDDPTGDSEEYEEFLKNFLNTESNSLLKKYLDSDMVEKLQNLEITSTDKTRLRDLIHSGILHPDSSIGIYASGPDAYSTFDALFDPIIKDYHKVEGEIAHPHTNWGKLSDTNISDFNKDSNNVISTRIRIARSIKGFPFNSKMTKDDYLNLEITLRKALNKIGGSLAGQYISLAEMSPQDHEQLMSEHLMFGECDKYLRDAAACRHWPAGRGVFLSEDRTLIIWVNEEDHLRIISLQKGGNLRRVYSRLLEAVRYLETHIEFERSEKLGYLTFCPSNLGTTLRASVHMRLPKLAKQGNLGEIAKKWKIQVRGTGGEHTAVTDGVVDLSNTRRLGITEIGAVQEMYTGIANIINMENQLG